MAETNIVPAKVSDSKTVRIEVTPFLAPPGMEREISSIPKALDFRDVAAGLKDIVDAIGEHLQSVKAKKTVVEFGVEIGVEAGQLTALIAKGSGKANLKITLEWS